MLKTPNVFRSATFITAGIRHYLRAPQSYILGLRSHNSGSWNETDFFRCGRGFDETTRKCSRRNNTFSGDHHISHRISGLFWFLQQERRNDESREFKPELFAQRDVHFWKH